MADNSAQNGTDTIATDDIAGVKHQRVKVQYGDDGSATDASATNPFPVSLNQAADGAAATGNPVIAGIFDGTNTWRARSAYGDAQASLLFMGTVPMLYNGTDVTRARSGSGVVGAGVQRVCLATDVALPAGTNIIGALSANQSINNEQVNGVNISTGNGVSGTGVQRVAIASDNSPVPVAAAGVNPTYRVFVPLLAVGANKVFFDLFNATGSGKTLKVLSVVPITSGATAVTGVVSVDLFLTRTTTVGTGGTAMTLEGTSLTAIAISKMDPASAALHANITARSAPTGGGTAGAVISGASLFTEETNAGTYLAGLLDFVRRIAGVGAPGVIVPENTGVRIVQGGTASVGNIGFDVIFETY